MNTFFEIGEVVWGKIKGYPWWPAIITDFTDSLIYTIKFYSDNSYAKLSSKYLLKYEENKNKILETNKKNKKLLGAIKAADSDLKNLKNINYMPIENNDINDIDKFQINNNPTKPKIKKLNNTLENFEPKKLEKINNNDLNNNLNKNIEIKNTNYSNIDNSQNIFNFSNRSGEITNPNYFFQRNNKDYYKYRLEQKKYLDYNYQIIKNRLNKRNKKEPDINPYNPINEQPFENGKTDLLHNPILNPINNYSYNKYLEKEVNLGNRYRKSFSNENYNINNNKKLNYNFSTLQNAGNQLLNN